VSTTASKRRRPAGRPAALINSPQGCLEQRELTGETGYVSVAQVAIDHHWTALRFRRGAWGETSGRCAPL